MKLVATCARGLEDVSAAEVAELTGACATPDHAKVAFAATWRQVAALQVGARTLHKVHLLLARAEVKDLADAEAVARGVDWAPFASPGQAIAVEPRRAGQHRFTSLDLGRVVGQVVVDSLTQAHGARPRVDLERPDVEVTALVRDQELLLGINLTGPSLHKRGYRVYQHPAPLRPSLAAALLRWAGYEGQPLWDPMCGSGTVPIEAALMARHLAPNSARPFLMERLPGFPPQALEEARAAALVRATDARPPILGSERFEKHLLGAAANARAAGVWDALELRVLDAARAQPGDLPFRPGLVVVNPPYGLRIASKRVVRKLYGDFLDRLAPLRPLRLAVLVGNRWFEEEAARRGLEPGEARDVMYGQLGARAVRFDL